VQGSLLILSGLAAGVLGLVFLTPGIGSVIYLLGSGLPRGAFWLNMLWVAPGFACLVVAARWIGAGYRMSAGTQGTVAVDRPDEENQLPMNADSRR
jgi:hypothetical protein